MAGGFPSVREAETPLSPGEFAAIRDQYEREEPNQSLQARFNYAWALIKSANRDQQLQGLRMLEAICRQEPERYDECIYYMALGYYKTGQYQEARRLCAGRREREVMELQKAIESKLTREGVLGMAIVAGTVAVATAFWLRFSR